MRFHGARLELVQKVALFATMEPLFPSEEVKGMVSAVPFWAPHPLSDQEESKLDHIEATKYFRASFNIHSWTPAAMNVNWCPESQVPFDQLDCVAQNAPCMDRELFLFFL